MAKKAKAETVKPADAVARPVLVDEQDGACELCAAHEAGKCDGCGKQIPVYENMGGNGYRSPRPTHYHLRAVLGVNGREAVFGEYCVACYRQAYKEAYPKEKVPV